MDASQVAALPKDVWFVPRAAIWKTCWYAGDNRAEEQLSDGAPWAGAKQGRLRVVMVGVQGSTT